MIKEKKKKKILRIILTLNIHERMHTIFEKERAYIPVKLLYYIKQLAYKASSNPKVRYTIIVNKPNSYDETLMERLAYNMPDNVRIESRD